MSAAPVRAPAPLQSLRYTLAIGGLAMLATALVACTAAHAEAKACHAAAEAALQTAPLQALMPCRYVRVQLTTGYSEPTLLVPIHAVGTDHMSADVTAAQNQPKSASATRCRVGACLLRHGGKPA